MAFLEEIIFGVMWETEYQKAEKLPTLWGISQSCLLPCVCLGKCKSFRKCDYEPENTPIYRITFDAFNRYDSL